MTSLTDKPLILQWEVWLRSLLGKEDMIKVYFEYPFSGRVPKERPQKQFRLGWAFSPARPIVFGFLLALVVFTFAVIGRCDCLAFGVATHHRKSVYLEITSWKVRAYCFYWRVEKYRKTNEWAQRTSEFSDTLQRVNKNRTKHFPWCYLFILLVLRFICEFFSVERLVLRDLSRAEHER